MRFTYMGCNINIHKEVGKGLGRVHRLSVVADPTN